MRGRAGEARRPWLGHGRSRPLVDRRRRRRSLGRLESSMPVAAALPAAHHRGQTSAIRFLLTWSLSRSSGHGRFRPLVGRRRRRRSYGRPESSTVDDAGAGSWPGRERVWSRFHSHSMRAPAIRGSVHAGVRRCGMLPSLRQARSTSEKAGGPKVPCAVGPGPNDRLISTNQRSRVHARVGFSAAGTPPPFAASGPAAGSVNRSRLASWRCQHRALQARSAR
jgi:hypothetical protein